MGKNVVLCDGLIYHPRSPCLDLACDSKVNQVPYTLPRDEVCDAILTRPWTSYQSNLGMG